LYPDSASGDVALSPNSITATLRSRGHKSWKFATQITSPTFAVYCNGLTCNWFVADLSRTLSQTSQHVEMVCVHDFPRGEVSVKVGVMELGLYTVR